MKNETATKETTMKATSSDVEKAIRSVGAKSCIVTAYSVDAAFTHEMKKSAELFRDKLAAFGYEVFLFDDAEDVEVSATMVPA